LARALRKLHISTSGCYECAYAGSGEQAQNMRTDISAAPSERAPLRWGQRQVGEKAGRGEQSSPNHPVGIDHPAGSGEQSSPNRQVNRLGTARTRLDASEANSCPVLREFNQQLEIALQEVADEWNL